MSLSQHERRVLCDIEEYLTEHDSQLARMLGSFGRSTPLRILAPRLLGHCRRVPLITATFLAFAAMLLGVAIGVRSPVVLIAAMAMVCVSVCSKRAGLRHPFVRRRLNR